MISCSTHYTGMLMYICLKTKVHRSLTCRSRYIHEYMSQLMYLSGCHGVTFYVIAIYSEVLPQLQISRFCSQDNVAK